MEIKEFINHKILTDKDLLEINLNNLSGARQSLWHATKIEHMPEVLSSMELKPYTSQRYWEDGKRYKDDHPNYEESGWMYGWSMTRKKEYAMEWGGVILELDHAAINQRFEIKPFSWNYLFKHNDKMKKKEFEEFVVASYFNKSIPQLKREEAQRMELEDELYDKIYEKGISEEEKERLKLKIKELEQYPSWMQIWKEPRGKSIDLNTCLKAIYLKDVHYEIYSKSSRNELSIILEHPKFKGIIKKPEETNKKTIKMKV